MNFSTYYFYKYSMYLYNIHTYYIIYSTILFRITIKTNLLRKIIIINCKLKIPAFQFSLTKIKKKIKQPTKKKNFCYDFDTRNACKRRKKTNIKAKYNKDMIINIFQFSYNVGFDISNQTNVFQVEGIGIITCSTSQSML